MGVCKCLSIMVLIFALCWKPLFRPYVLPVIKEPFRTPLDTSVGIVPVLSTSELTSVYKSKRVLIVGGTRGVGRGVSLAMVGAGAHVTVVGRSNKTGEKILKELRPLASSEQNVEYIQGDLGSIASSMSLLTLLARHAGEKGRFDYLVVTAAVFPDWNNLQQEDGFDHGFAVAVIGRYIIYRHANQFMALESDPNSNSHVRILNVLASGEELPIFSRDLAVGSRNSTNLFENIMTFGNGNELMFMGLEQRGPSTNFGTTRVSTHPGLLQTDLHRNQGWLMDLFEPIAVALIGLSEEECGIRQASILASPRLRPASLTYVDQDMKGRLRGRGLEAHVKEHFDWLWELIDRKVP